MVWLLLFLGVLGFAWFMYMPREGAGNGARGVGNQGRTGAGAGSRVQYQPPQNETGYGMTNAGRQPQGFDGATTGAEPPALVAQADTAPDAAGADTVPEMPTGLSQGYPIERTGTAMDAGVDPMTYAVMPEVDTPATASTAGGGTATGAGTGYGANNDDAGFLTSGYGDATAGTATTGYDATAGTAPADYEATSATAGGAETDFTAANATANPTDTAGYGATDAGYGATNTATADAGAGANANPETNVEALTSAIDVTDAATAGIGAAGMDVVTADDVPADPD